MSQPRVLIVDDHQLFRAGVRSELDPLLEVVGEASGVAEAVRAIRELERAGVRAAFLNAIQAAMERSRELASGEL